jgi:hypothetical protein
LKALTLILIGLLIPLATFPTKPVAAIQTAPKFTFAVVGDFGNITSGSHGYSVLQKIASSRPYPNFTIALGDFAYNYSSPANWCGNFTRIYPNVVLITGNHDTKNYNSNAFTYKDHSTGIPSDTLTNETGMGFLDTTSSSGSGYISACGVPPGINWVGSSVNQTGATCLSGTLLTPSCYAREYYFDYPGFNPIMRFIMISAGILGSWVGTMGYAAHTCPDTPLSHYCWLSARIDDAHNAGLWVAVVTHKNCITAGVPSQYCASTFAPFNLTMTKGVDLWLDGHDHTYQRSFQLAPPCSISNNVASCTVPPNPGNGQSPPYLRGSGTVINIVGTGGVGNDGLCTSCSSRGMFASLCGSSGPVSLGCSNDYGFSNFTITTNQISAQYVSATGSFTDRYVISVPNPPGDFSVSAIPVVPTPTLRRGLVLPNNTISVKLNSFGHFSGSLTLTASVTAGAPKTCSLSGCPSTAFSQGTVSLTDGSTVSSNLTISLSNSTPCGNFTSPEKYVVTVTATPASGSVRQVTFSFYVYARGDVNLDGRVDISDLVLVAGVFGTTNKTRGFNPNADLNKDGIINISDLTIVGGDFGARCWP